MKNIESITNLKKKMSNILRKIWYWIVGYPAELTYWFEGKEFLVHVRKFRELKPNHITFMNVETEKYVAIKSDTPIKYILKQE